MLATDREGVRERKEGERNFEMSCVRCGGCDARAHPEAINLPADKTALQKHTGSFFFFFFFSFFFFLSLRLLENALLNDAFTLSKADYSNQQFCRQELNCKDENIKSF